MSLLTEPDVLSDVDPPSRAVRRDAERQTKQLRKNPHRRRQFLSRVRADHSVIRSTLATLEALLEHSDDTAGPAHPSQARLARLAGVDVRTVRRHLAELRDAGYLLVYVSPADRDAATGRYRRRRTNRYYFTLCNTPGGGKRRRRNRSSDLQGTEDLTNPCRDRNPRPVNGGGGGFSQPVLTYVKQKRDARRTSPPSAPSTNSHGTWSNNNKGCPECDFTRWTFDETGLATPCACCSTAD